MKIKKIESTIQQTVHIIEEFSLPLIISFVVGLVWFNVNSISYNKFFLTELINIHDHSINLKFIINDCFMVAFLRLLPLRLNKLFCRVAHCLLGTRVSMFCSLLLVVLLVQ